MVKYWCVLGAVLLCAHTSMAARTLRFLSAAESAALDAALMSQTVHRFSIDQLMELAGLAVATAVHKVYSPASYPRALIVCGPGNNGGDGLVAARHMWHFGYAPTVVYPKRPSTGDAARLFGNLVQQVEDLGIAVLPAIPHADSTQPQAQFDVLVDAVFGFSFSGTLRPPFDDVLSTITRWSERGAVATDAEASITTEGTRSSVIRPRMQSKVRAPASATNYIPVVSVDVPSGWHVEEGDVHGIGLRPSMLISLTAPKLCARFFDGAHHWLGGRFVPPAIARMYGLDTGLPRYPGAEQVVDLLS